MAVKEFHLPDIGEGIAEGEIVKWHVKAGDTIKEEQEFVEVMTDKATVMITAPLDGKVLELKVKEGDVVPVESVIAVLEPAVSGGAKKEATPKKDAAPKTDAAPAAPSKDEPTGKQAAKPTPQTPKSEPAPATASVGGNGAGATASPGKVLAAPATRRRAREMGIDLSQVRGTGPRGRVMNEDLNRFLQAPTAPAAPAEKPTRAPVSVAPAPAGATEERVPFRGLRRTISNAMARSKQTAAHFTYVEELDVTELVALRKEAKALYQDQGVNVTYLPFIMKALLQGLKRFPWLNSSLDETTNEVVLKKYYHFGIATDTEDGLVVPVVKDVDKKSIVELARDVQELAQKVRDKKAAPADLQGSTFTITNAGNLGGVLATPVINFPEVAILGVHKIAKRPVVRNDQIVIAEVMWLSMSIDHRIVDGATGARCMNVIKDLLENPRKLLLGAL